MEVILLQEIGFCHGVRRAIDIIENISSKRQDKKIYTLGEIIHNNYVLDELRKKGINPVDLPTNIEDAILILRTHGVSPEILSKLENKKLEIVDSTCPTVLKVQSIVKRYASSGYHIVVIGDHGHSEVESLVGFADKNKVTVISRKEEISNIKFPDEVCIVSQTTQSEKNFSMLVNEIKKKVKNVVIFNTICNETIKRQREVIKLSKNVDAMIVIGGKQSANSKRLYEMCKTLLANVYFIENADELKGTKIFNFGRVGVATGTSTPDAVINEVVDYLSRAK